MRINQHLATSTGLQLLLLLGVASFFSGCSQYSTGGLSVGYHNLNAKFNAYIIARDKMREAEMAMRKNRKEDYNQILPILPILDSTEAQPVNDLLQDVIKKASLVPDRHQNSKWVDNAYVLIGKARLYKGQFTDGIETLRYVNAKGRDEEDKHEGLIWLMRAYVETKDYNSALSVAEYLRSQPLNDKNTRDYYLVKAYLHQQKQEYTLSLAILEETFDLLPKGEETARIHFSAAQMYDLLEKPQAANVHYKEVFRNNPSYDLGFFANMNSLQNDALTNTNVSTEGGFKRMLSDRKNSDLRDRLYYSMGVIETRKKNYPAAIRFFEESVRQTTTNTTQVPYTYLEMAKVYYDKLQNYELAKAYFDSSLALLPKTSPQFQKITERKDVLDEFVKQLTTIRTEDSLQRLSQMNPGTLDKFLDGVIEKELEEQARKVKEAQKLVEQARTLNANVLNFNGDPADRFVLSDPTAMALGKTEFRQRWGNRPLEDDWRRSSKVAALLTQTDNITPVASGQKPANANSNGDAVAMTKDSPEWKAKKDALYRNIPLKKTELDASNQRMEDAYYKLGKIYKFSLVEPENAVKTFLTTLERFPATNYKPELYYLLFLTDQKGKPEDWKAKLLAEFPNSSYTRLLTKTNGSIAATGNPELEAIKDYEKILNLYQNANYSEAFAQLEMAIVTYSGSKVEDKYALLRIYLLGKLQGREAYLKALNSFIKDFPTSPLLPRVREVLEAQQSTSIKKNG
ncbi:tetratricopeptide repeat protein [Runella sp.]|uniref:type IX secretion system periplasmic lipoprotein PorW/SprE n=1 Tax=Runella sp. TaxID=1960881 RepID=UPI003D1365F7